MRSLQGLKDNLQAMLQESPTWRRLLRGLIGQELLSWGASAAYLDDVSYDSMTKDIHPSSASDLGLSLLSASYGIPFQNFSPGYILYKYEGSDAMKPYELTYAFNGFTWFNTEPILSGDVTPRIVKLFQGKPAGVVSFLGAFQKVFPNIQDVFEVQQKDIFLDQDNAFFYIRLKGDNIIPSSIRVHTLSVVNTTPTTTYKARLMTSEEMSSATFFSVYSLPDGGQAVRFHDAIPDIYQITYMTADLSLPEAGDVVLPLVSVSNPSSDNLSKRSGFMERMAKDSSLSTSTQIEKFCRAVGVIDAKAEKYQVTSGAVSVVVFFIPSVNNAEENSYFEHSLSEALSLYGTLASNFKVQAGSEIKFQVNVISDGFSFDKASFEALVRDYFSTVNPPSFTGRLSEDLLVYAHSNGFMGITLNYLLTFASNQVRLLPAFRAILDNYKFYQGGVLKGWSFGSQINGHSGDSITFSQTDSYFVMSDSVFVKKGDQFYIFDKVSGLGSYLNLPPEQILAVGANMIILDGSTTSSGIIRVLSLNRADQLHAINTGVLPGILQMSLPATFRDTIRIYDNGFFSYRTGANRQLFQALGLSIASFDTTPDLLFVYEGVFYFPSSDPNILLRKTSLSQSTFTEISVAVYGTTALNSQTLFQESFLRFFGDIMSARRPDGKTFMFTLGVDASSLVATSFSAPLDAGIDNAFPTTTVPARWDTATDKPVWLSFEGGSWSQVPFAPVIFSVQIGSILADGSPNFTNSFEFDNMTVETSSVAAFSSYLDVVYFRLNGKKPVIFNEQ